MHFQRNPPGPNTSRIEGFAAAPSATVGSSSNGTYSRGAVFAARLSFAAGGSSVELDMRFARNPPLLSPGKTWRPVTIAYPSVSLPSARRRHQARYSNSLDSGHLRVEHATSLCRAVLHYRCVTFGSALVSAFHFRGANANPSSWGPHESHQDSSVFSNSLAGRLLPDRLQRPQESLHHLRWRKPHGKPHFGPRHPSRSPIHPFLQTHPSRLH